VLAFVDLPPPQYCPSRLQLFAFLSQLKKARGFVIVGAHIQGDPIHMYRDPLSFGPVAGFASASSVAHEAILGGGKKKKKTPSVAVNDESVRTDSRAGDGSGGKKVSDDSRGGGGGGSAAAGKQAEALEQQEAAAERKRAQHANTAVAAANEHVKAAMSAANLSGFHKIVVHEDKLAAQSFLVQAPGLGALEPNTVLIEWPRDAKEIEDRDFAQRYVTLFRLITAARRTTIVAKGLDQFPLNNERRSGTIDIWWIVYDGGLLLLLPHLLRKHRVWQKCQVRLFLVAQLQDNSIQMEADMKETLRRLRIDATVEVVEMLDQEISAYVQQRTLYQADRARVVEELGVSQNVRANMLTVQASKAMKSRSDPGAAKLVKQKTKRFEHMNTAVKLNDLMTQRSGDAELVLLSMPPQSKDQTSYEYLDYVNVLIEGLDCALLVRGSGMEVVTVYS